MNNFSQIYVVGDIHGCWVLLKMIQQKIIEMSKNTSGEKLLIYLGDYIDRGLNIKETIQTLLDFQPKDFQCIFLLGIIRLKDWPLSRSRLGLNIYLNFPSSGSSRVLKSAITVSPPTILWPTEIIVGRASGR